MTPDIKHSLQKLAEELGFGIDDSNMFSDGWPTDKRHFLLWQSLRARQQELEEARKQRDAMEKAIRLTYWEWVGDEGRNHRCRHCGAIAKYPVDIDHKPDCIVLSLGKEI